MSSFAGVFGAICAWAIDVSSFAGVFGWIWASRGDSTNGALGSVAVDPLLTTKLKEGGVNLRFNLFETILVGEPSERFVGLFNEVGEAGSLTMHLSAQ